MKGLISFHPVDLEFFDGLVQPLVAGEKVNPEFFLDMALSLRRTAWETQRYKQALRALIDQAEPPPPPSEGSVWDKVRARLERFDHRPDPVVGIAVQRIDPDLHLDGRPFLITEGSAERVGALADEYLEARDTAAVGALVREQLVRLDPNLAPAVAPTDVALPSADMSYRTDLLKALKELHDLARAARQDESWTTETGARLPAREVLQHELAWRSLMLHSRAVPFWLGLNVDGLETICSAAGVNPPEFLVPAWRLFSGMHEDYPAFRESLSVELREERQVGAFVAPADVDDLIAFLNVEGAGIIRVATRHGEGATCNILLRKIRECAHYAQRHGAGYLEASGIPPIVLENEEEEADATT
jgi:hypothetical protein